MADLLTSPTTPHVGQFITISGNGYNPGDTIVVSILELGFSSDIVADNAGDWGTNDIADHAQVTLTSDATIPTAADTVTVGGTVYTFRAAASIAGEVTLGISAATALANLRAAINGDAHNTANANVVAGALTATTLVIIAKTGGTAGNSIASTETSTHLSFGTATLAGGSAATGVSAIIWTPVSPGTFTITASDTHGSAVTSTVQVSTE